MKIIRQVVGIDISKKKFDFCIASRNGDYSTSFSKPQNVENTMAGFTALKKKLTKLGNDDLIVFMEATGNYYEQLAHFFSKENIKVCIVLPNKIKAFGKSFNLKAKTDKIDAGLIAAYGIERVEALWEPPSETARRMREKTREHQTLTEELTRLKVRKKTLLSGFEPDKSGLSRMDSHIHFLKQLIKQIDAELEKLIQSDQEIKQKIERIMDVEGLGKTSIIKILSEINFFENFTSMKQVASYSGLDVKVHESGTFKGKGKISKKGNEHIRRTMYMPALSAIKHNKEMRVFYKRLVSRGKNGKAALLAVARKLLLLIFTLWKTGRKYDPDYKQNLSITNN